MTRNQPTDVAPVEPPTLLTAAQVGRLAQVSSETVRRWARDGLIPFIELPSGHMRFDPADVRAWLTKATAVGA
jgi:excisionase family DNA binding protein